MCVNKMQPHQVLVLCLLILQPDYSSQTYYRDADRYGYGRQSQPNYYENYYRYTHNQPINGYYGFGYGGHGGYGSSGYGPRDDYGRGGYEGRSLGGGGYYQGSYDFYYPRGYSAPPPAVPSSYQGYYGDDYYGRGRSYESPKGYYQDPRSYYNGRPPYEDYGYRSRYPLTPGWGSYDYFYGRSARDQPPAGRNVDPFPGKFLGFGSVQYEKGRRDVQLQCHLSKDGNKPVSNVVWVRVENAYRQPSYGPPPVTYTTNPYYCPIGGCIYKDIDFSNQRFFADMHGDVATLHIYDLQPRDFGIYRCSVTAQANTGSSSDTEAAYQIVEFFN